jgi:hypothetical protein
MSRRRTLCRKLSVFIVTGAGGLRSNIKSIADLGASDAADGHQACLSPVSLIDYEDAAFGTLVVRRVDMLASNIGNSQRDVRAIS